MRCVTVCLNTPPCRITTPHTCSDEPTPPPMSHAWMHPLRSHRSAESHRPAPITGGNAGDVDDVTDGTYRRDLAHRAAVRESRGCQSSPARWDAADAPPHAASAVRNDPQENRGRRGEGAEHGAPRRFSCQAFSALSRRSRPHERRAFSWRSDAGITPFSFPDNGNGAHEGTLDTARPWRQAASASFRLPPSRRYAARKHSPAAPACR